MATVAPRIETTRLGASKPWIGQLVPVNVDVWRPESDAPLEPFSLDDVVASGMIVKWSEQASPPDEKHEGDTRFLVQHRTLLVFPQRDGELTLPPIVARWTDSVTKASLVARSAPLHFTAASPPAVGSELPLIAGSVAIQQSFDRDLSTLRVGDGFTAHSRFTPLTRIQSCFPNSRWPTPLERLAIRPRRRRPRVRNAANFRPI